MFDMQKIGKKIASLRKDKNMTQMELADKLGISFQAVSNWERGDSMPDIAKLPELAEIFEVSLDELLGEKSVLVEAAIDDRMTECVENGAVSTAEMESVLPLLKPSQVSDIVQVAEKTPHFDMSGIVKFLPFMSEKDVTEFAEQVWRKGESVRQFLPFMHGTDVKRFAQAALAKGEKINDFLPFLFCEDVKELASEKFERGEKIVDFLPFMNGDDVRDLAFATLEKGEQVDQYLPFMDEDDVKELALKVLKGKM